MQNIIFTFTVFALKMFKDNHQKIAKVMVTFVVEVDVKNKGYLAESVTQRWFSKKFSILQNSQEYTCAEVFFKTVGL